MSDNKQQEIEIFWRCSKMMDRHHVDVTMTIRQQPFPNAHLVDRHVSLASIYWNYKTILCK
jgi:hypothetical protein